MPHQDYEKLARHLQTNEALQKAAMSGMAAGIQKELQKQGITDVSADALNSLGKTPFQTPHGTGTGTGNPVADDYVVRGVSSVIAAVKVKVADLQRQAEQWKAFDTMKQLKQEMGNQQ